MPGLKKIYYFVKFFLRINWYRTIYFNFRAFNTVDAFKLPVLIFGKVKINAWQKPTIIINHPLKFGIIKIGERHIDLVPGSTLPTQLFLSGTLEFDGPCIIGGGCAIHVERKSKIKIGKNVLLGSGGFLKSWYHISIGDNTRVAYGFIIFDSNIHYIKTIEDGKIEKNYGSISIGKNCWISSRANVTKGAVLPDYSILAGSSYLNKDFSKYGENLFLVGSPATLSTKRVQRILSVKKEQELNRFFYHNPFMEFIQEDIGLYDDENDLFTKR